MTITIDNIKNMMREYIYLIDDHVIDVMLAAIVATRLPGDAICLYIVGPSSSAKTEVIRSLRQYSKSVHISKITPSTLLSGYIEPGIKKSERKNASLLLQMKDAGQNIMVFKDFTTIMSMRHEDKMEFISHIRELADGYITAYFGNDQSMSFDMPIGTIAGCTNAIDEFSQATDELGERFLKYRVYAEMSKEIARMAGDAIFTKDDLRIKVATMVDEFLKKFEIIFERPDINSECRMKLETLCILAAHIRSSIVTDRKSGAMVTPAVHEGPGRLIALLTKMCVALALIRGDREAGLDIYVIIKKIIRDTLSQYRMLILKSLYELGSLLTDELATMLRVNHATVRKYCDELYTLQIISRSREIDSKGRSYVWELENKYRQLIDECELFLLDKF